jgi:hypothetical protein
VDIYESRFSSPFYQVDRKLRSLMHFYEQNVCPWIVAFDGPDNPYRKHIMVLATTSQALQHAIAALAENNHLKRTHRPSGFIEDAEDPSKSRVQVRRQSQLDEGQSLKKRACHLLNKQLEAPDAAQDDSVLATILVLCLLSVCDTGVSRMTSQLEGVQKILQRRNPTSQQSDFLKWVQMFFIWFDVMTSAVNERETRITGHGLDWQDLRTDMGAMEELSGCDGRLFKVIAKLGRLDLLAQGKPVRAVRNDMPASSGRLVMPALPIASGSMGGSPRTSAPEYQAPSIPSVTAQMSTPSYDGATMAAGTESSARDSLGADASFVSDIDHNWPFPSLDQILSGHDSETRFPDDRVAFWQEWHDVRFALETWTPSAKPSPTHETPEQRSSRIDMEHINQSFRYACFLFTERLADPFTPSSAPRFQRHVMQGMQHIREIPVDSCVTKFLLWPLFILGTECAVESHRDLIRARCVAIHRESAFENNLSGLGMLKRIWAEISPGGFGAPGADEVETAGRYHDYEESRKGRLYGRPLRWRRFMMQIDGEYIVL